MQLLKKQHLKKLVLKKQQSKKVAVKKAASKKVAPKKAAVKKTAPKKAAAKKVAAKPPVDTPKKPRLTKKQRELKIKQDNLSKEDKKLWEASLKKYKDTKAVPYDMKKTYAKETILKHRDFGWGFVISESNYRLEVLFEQGRKTLISNYKV